MADMSNLSFSSPAAPRRSGAMGRILESPPEDEDSEDEDETVQDMDEVSLLVDEAPDDDDDSDPTVTLRPPSPRSIPLPAEDTTSRPQSASPLTTPIPVPETPDPHKRHKVRVTTELEQIVVCALLNIQHFCMLIRHLGKDMGNYWRAAEGRPRQRRKSAKGKGDTVSPLKSSRTRLICHIRVILEQLSNSTPAPSSPSISMSSFSATAPAATATAQPSAQQILTAHMLLTLLSTPPTYSMPFGHIKEVLSEKLTSIGVRASAVGGAGTTRPVYGCVAKRLLKFERGGREQVVRFDV